MNFFLAILTWLVIATVLGWAVLVAVKGNPWFLLVAMLAFVVLVARTGCKTH